MSLKILIADDHGLVRAGLTALLEGEPGFHVVGEARDSEEALMRCMELSPDIALIDLDMPGIGGIETTREIVKRQPSVRVLVVTMHEDPALLREVIRAGGAGYLIKRAVGSELINALNAVAQGDLYIHPAMTRALFIEENGSKPPNSGLQLLTSRELEVLRLIVQGHTNRQMADAMNLSVRTVETHRAKLMSKLGLSSRVELVRYASRHGLIEPE